MNFAITVPVCTPWAETTAGVAQGSNRRLRQDATNVPCVVAESVFDHVLPFIVAVTLTLS